MSDDTDDYEILLDGLASVYHAHSGEQLVCDPGETTEETVGPILAQVDMLIARLRSALAASEAARKEAEERIAHLSEGRINVVEALVERGEKLAAASLEMERMREACKSAIRPFALALRSGQPLKRISFNDWQALNKVFMEYFETEAERMALRPQDTKENQ